MAEVSRARHHDRSSPTVRWSSLVGLMVAVLALSAPVLGGVVVENRMLGAGDASSAGLVILDPSSGSNLVLSSPADWAAGTQTDTAGGASGVTLAHRGEVPPTASPTWWDTAWGVRRCVTISNPGAAQTEFPVEVTLDTASPVGAGDLLADAADLRAVDSATGNELPLWVEGPVPSTASTVWVQLVSMPTGSSEFCLYHGNPAATTVSDPLAPFTYSTRTTRYYTGSDRWGNVSIVSYVDGNQVGINGGAPATLDAGQTLTVAAGKDTVIDATGPIAGASTDIPTDTIMPESFADTQFIFAVNRNTQEIWVRAPFGPATVEFQVAGAVVSATRIGGGTAPSHTIAPGDGFVGFVADAGGDESVVVRSTTGVPFLANHKTSQNSFAVAGIPWRAEPHYGVPTRNLLVAAGTTAANYQVLESDGSVINGAVGPSGLDSHGGNGARGRPPGARITADARFAANSFADQNGRETSAFWPESMLEAIYRLPLPMNYVTITCPTPGQTVTRTNPGGATSSYTCTGTGGAGAPGHAWTGLTSIASGTTFSSDAPFFLMAEKQAGDGEINVLGAKAARPRPSLAPSVAVGSLQGLYTTAGTWQSATYDTSVAGVFGFLDIGASAPAGTSLQVQVATGATAAAAQAATPVGPDGTAGTTFGAGTGSLDPGHDFDRYVRYVVRLDTTDPLVSPVLTTLDLTVDLQEYVGSDPGTTEITLAAGPGLDSHLLARMHGSGTLTYDTSLHYRAGTNLPAATLVTVRTDEPADHVRVVGGVLVQGQGAPAALVPSQVRSILVDEDVITGETITMTVAIRARDADGVVIEHDLVLTLQA